MGQYYKPILLNDDGTIRTWFYSHHYDNGLKLMEHSYLRNDFVGRVEVELLNSPCHLVWAGDYADNEDQGDVEGEGRNLFMLSKDMEEAQIQEGLGSTSDDRRYIINHTKRLYIDKTKCPKSSDGWHIHPLPLLTCEGNGQGGGDYFSSHGQDDVGSWSRDTIEIRRDIDDLDDYIEAQFDFVEE